MTVAIEPAHKFAVGQQVKMRRSRMSTGDSPVYEVTRLLPSEKDDFQYQIRLLNARADRVVFESQLA